MNSFRHLFLPLATAAFISACAPIDRPYVGGHPAEVHFGIYDTLPRDYAGPYYSYGNRYYWGGRWETGRFMYRGRHYDGRYFHNGHYFYGGRFHAGGLHHHR